MMGRVFRWGLGVAAVAALLDQGSKAVVLARLGDGGQCAGVQVVPVNSVFDLVLTCNTGVSFGLFNRSGVSSLIFSLAAAAVVVALVIWLSRARTAFLGMAIGLIIGGAIGNVIDRFRLGGVVDFLYFHLPVAACREGYGSLWDGCWPAFNLADSAICVGVTAMLLDGLWLRHPPQEVNPGEDVRHDRA